MSLDTNFGVAVPGTIQSIYPIPDSNLRALKNHSIHDDYGGRWKICYLNDDGSQGKEVRDLQSKTIEDITQIFKRELLSDFDETSIKEIDQIDLGGFHKIISSKPLEKRTIRTLSDDETQAMQRIQKLALQHLSAQGASTNGMSFVGMTPGSDDNQGSAAKHAAGSGGKPRSAAKHAANDGLNGSPQPHPQLDDSNTTNKRPASIHPQTTSSIRDKFCSSCARMKTFFSPENKTPDLEKLKTQARSLRNKINDSPSASAAKLIQDCKNTNPKVTKEALASILVLNHELQKPKETRIDWWSKELPTDPQTWISIIDHLQLCKDLLDKPDSPFTITSNDNGAHENQETSSVNFKNLFGHDSA